MTDSRDRDLALRAADLLGKIAPGTKSAGDVITALAEVVRSGHPSRRRSAFEALGEFGPAAEPAVPVIIRALREILARKGGSAFPGGFSAAMALGRIAPGTRSADEALAALIEALDPHAGSDALLNTRFGAMDALPAFGSRAASAIPRLRAWQNRSDGRLKVPATRALAAIERAQSESRNRGGNGSR